MTTLPAQLPAHLRADCSACVGICCVAAPFDAVQGFGFDKPAETACTHLCSDFRCGIHDELAAQGFKGCMVFDCHGAGQHVTARLAPGPDWMRSAATARPVFEAYAVLRPLHESLALLQTARRHVDDARLAAQQAKLQAASERVTLDGVDGDGLRRETVALLRDPVIVQALRTLQRR